MIIAGVDLGVRKAAIAIFDDGYLGNVAHLEVPPISRSQELRTLGYWSWQHLKMCDSIYIEEPLGGRNLRTSLRIAQTAGAVMASIGLVDNYLIPVDAWKKEVIGKGGVNKQAIASWLQANHPSYAEQCQGNQDRVDAVCIGLYGVLVHDRSGNLDKL